MKCKRKKEIEFPGKITALDSREKNDKAGPPNVGQDQEVGFSRYGNMY